MSRSTNFSPGEIDVIISSVEECPQLIYSEFGGDMKTKEDHKKKWVEIAEKVNSVGLGDIRSSVQIKNKWHDLKYRVRQKAIKLIHKYEGTNVVSVCENELTSVEKKVISLLCRNSFQEVTGHDLDITHIKQALRTARKNDIDFSPLPNEYDKVEERNQNGQVNQKHIISPVIVSVQGLTEYTENIDSSSIASETSLKGKRDRTESSEEVYYAAVIPMPDVDDEENNQVESEDDTNYPTVTDTASSGTIQENDRTESAATTDCTAVTSIKLNSIEQDNDSFLSCDVVSKDQWPSYAKQKSGSSTLRVQRHRLKRRRLIEEEEKRIEKQVVETQTEMAKDLKNINASLKNIEKALEINNRNQRTMITLLAKYLNVEVPAENE